MKITVWLVGPGDWRPEMIFTDRTEAERFSEEFDTQPIYEATALVDITTIEEICYVVTFDPRPVQHVAQLNGLRRTTLTYARETIRVAHGFGRIIDVNDLSVVD